MTRVLGGPDKGDCHPPQIDYTPQHFYQLLLLSSITLKLLQVTYTPSSELGNNPNPIRSGRQQKKWPSLQTAYTAICSILQLLNHSQRKVHLIIIQIVHLDHVILLIFRPSIPDPAIRVVIDILVGEILPPGIRKCFQ